MFLDRDGVLVRGDVVDGRPYAIHPVGELELERGARDACEALRAAGFLLVVVTNQPEIARGTLARAAVDEIHERLRELCRSTTSSRVLTTTPTGAIAGSRSPGMLLDAASRLGIDLAASFLIGDRWRDIEAGRRAGCTHCLPGPGVQ